MRCPFLLTLGTTIFVGSASASQDVIAESTFPLPNGKGTAYVLVRKTEMNIGLPYSIEIRVSCGSGREATGWAALPSVDSRSVCDVKPKSVKLAKGGGRVIVKVREPDADAYNARSRIADPTELGRMVPECKKASAEIELPLESYCP